MKNNETRAQTFLDRGLDKRISKVMDKQGNDLFFETKGNVEAIEKSYHEEKEQITERTLIRKSLNP